MINTDVSNQFFRTKQMRILVFVIACSVFVGEDAKTFWLRR